MEKADAAPRGEDGKFVAKQKEAPEAKTEETPAEETPEEEVQEEAPARKFKIKYNGEDREVEETEAVELAQKGYDYTQKMQKLAKDREEIQARVRSENEARAKEYEQALETHRRAVERLSGVDNTIDLNKLAQEDPVRAQQEFFKRLQIQQTLGQIDAEQQKLTQQRQTEMQASMRKQAEEALETLQSEIPGWSNDLYGKVLKGAVKDYGFKQTEVNAITDHRAIKVLHDAMKWRELQAAKPKTSEKRVVSVPKVQKPGTTEKADPKAGKLAEGMAKLQKSGHRDDAVAYLAELMEQGKL
jgi:hypothetical protein